MENILSNYRPMQCPGTEEHGDCVFVAIPEDLNGLSWTCEAGYFCQSPFQSELCTNGYYCPENSFQPVICPAKYYCKSPKTIERCMEGYYCPDGTVNPIPCTFAICPPGSERRFNSLIFLYLFVAYFFLITIYNSFNRYIQTTRSHEWKDVEMMSRGERKHSQSTMILENIALRMKQIPILNPLSAQFSSGRLCAILGPSGSGKSTLLQIIAGILTPTTGSVTFRSSLDIKLGFVPQDDIILPEFTVVQTFKHYAQMKRGLKHCKDVDDEVNLLINTLGLTSIKHRKLGSIEKRGISGGEKRRVNIGIEFLLDPSVLLLDEPTSGLDSSSAYEICVILKKYCKEKNIMVIASLHCPSRECFDLIDDVILLNDRGKLCFAGETSLLKHFFEAMEYQIPSESQYFDLPSFYLDVITGRVHNEHVKGEDIPYCWNRYSGNQIFVLSEEPLVKVKNFLCCWFGQFYLLSKRSYLQIMLHGKYLLYDHLTHIATGFLIGLACKEFDYTAPMPNSVCELGPPALILQCKLPRDLVKTTGVFLSLGILYIGISSASTTFGKNYLVIARELRQGASPSAYYLSKLVADVPRILLSAILFTFSFSLLYHNQASLSFIFIPIILLYYYAFSFGHLLSLMLKRSNIGLAATAVTMVFALGLSGVVPDLQKIKNDLKYVSWIWNLSGPRWSIELFWIIDVGASGMRPEVPMNAYRYEHFGMSILLIIGLSLCLNMLSFIVFYFIR